MNNSAYQICVKKKDRAIYGQRTNSQGFIFKFKILSVPNYNIVLLTTRRDDERKKIIN